MPLTAIPEGFAVAAFWSLVHAPCPEACWPWMGRMGNRGYGLLNISLGDRRTTAGAHRVAALLAFGPSAALVLHGCDNRACCNPAHLWFGTYRDNSQDMGERGRRPAVYRSKLSDEDVRQIRALRGLARQVDIAARFGIRQSHVSKIQRGAAKGGVA
jgi:hypothetical protein